MSTTAGIDITDYLLFRMREYSRLIAGLALPFPFDVLKATEKIAPELFRDERVREFLDSLRARRADLEASSDPAGLAVKIAEASPHYYDILGFAITSGRVVSFCDLDELCKELIRMANAANVITRIAREIPKDGQLDNLPGVIHQAIQKRAEVQP